jgi:hypothetical protein
LIDLLKTRKPERKKLEKLYTAERARRAKLMDVDLTKGTGGEQDYYSMLSRLKGELVPEKPTFPSVRGEGETLYRSGRKSGKWWSKSKEYADDFTGREKQVIDIPADAKIYDGKIENLMTKGEASLVEKNILNNLPNQENKRIVEKIYDRALKRNEYDGFKTLDEGEGGVVHTTYYLSNPEKLSSNIFGQTKVDELFKDINHNTRISVFEKVSAGNGLSTLLNGGVPPNSQLSLMEEVFGRELIEAIPKSGGTRLKDIITEGTNIPRAFMTSFDMSAPLRQGVIFSTTKPGTAIKAGREMFRQAFSQKNFDNWLETLKQSPEFQLMKDSGLYISEPHRATGGLTAKEEAFMTNYAQKIPVFGQIIKASERAYIGFLNKMRADVFTNLSKKFIKDGLDPNVDIKEFRALAEFVNTATGRGSMGRLNRISQELNTLFFSPKLIASRFNMFTMPFRYQKFPWKVRKEAIKSMAEFIGVGSTILALAKLGGAKVETDPRSTDFGKIRVKNTRWDIWGGFQQWARVAAQIFSGQRKTSKGKIRDIDPRKFPFESRLDVAAGFMRGKLSPPVGLATELAETQKMYGGDITLKGEAYNKLVPMYIQDITEAYEDLGPDALMTVGVPAFFGVGAMTYESPGGF